MLQRRAELHRQLRVVGGVADASLGPFQRQARERVRPFFAPVEAHDVVGRALADVLQEEAEIRLALPVRGIRAVVPLLHHFRGVPVVPAFFGSDRRVDRRIGFGFRRVREVAAGRVPGRASVGRVPGRAGAPQGVVTRYAPIGAARGRRRFPPRRVRAARRRSSVLHAVQGSTNCSRPRASGGGGGFVADARKSGRCRRWRSAPYSSASRTFRLPGRAGCVLCLGGPWPRIASLRTSTRPGFRRADFR